MKILNFARSTLLSVTVGALLAACTAPPRGTPTNTYVGNQAGKQQEYLGDPDLARMFVLLDIKTERRDGRLRVQFDLKNTSGADLPIEWSIAWKDASGFNVDTNPHWRPTMVAGKGFESIQDIAPVPEATSFQLQIRRPSPIR